MKAINFFISLIIVSALSCKTNTDKPSSQPKDFIEKTVDFVISNKDNKTIELRFIYDSLISHIPSDSDETLILAESLKKRGFKVVDWGRGNYPPRGPRIISLTLTKDDCICKLNKIYYSTVSDGLYEAAERIKCGDSTAVRKENEAIEEILKKMPI